MALMTTQSIEKWCCSWIVCCTVVCCYVFYTNMFLHFWICFVL